MMVKKGLKVSRCIANSTEYGRMISKSKFVTDKIITETQMDTPLKFLNGFVFFRKKGWINAISKSNE